MKIVVFGGAFDPPHKEHVALAYAAVKELNAERLLIVPTFSPKHKSGSLVSFADRLALCKAAFKIPTDSGAKKCALEYSSLEFERGENNFSYLLLPVFKRQYGDIVFLTGADGIQNFSTWKNPAAIAEVCPIAIGAREGFDDLSKLKRDFECEYGGRLIEINFKGKDISSSVLKTMLLLGEEEAFSFLPKKVSEIIKQDGLYSNFDTIVQKLKSEQSPSLYNHTKAVAVRAAELNTKHNLGLDFTKVFLAAALHDNAKDIPAEDFSKTALAAALDCREGGLSGDYTVPEDSLGTSVQHQFLGARRAKDTFGITDDEILNAIRFHTTGKADMTPLERLIYTADSTSKDRVYDPIPKLAAITDKNFEEGFRAVLKYTYDKVLKSGRPMYPLTAEAVDFYLK